MINLKFKVKGDLIEAPVERIIIPADTLNYVRFDYKFDKDWDNTLKTAYFKNSNVDMIYQVPLDLDDGCLIPWEVLVLPGRLFMNLKGIQMTDSVVSYQITTEPISFDVIHDSMTDAIPSMPPSPTEYERFVANVEEAANRAFTAMTNAQEARTGAETAERRAEAAAEASAESANASAQSAEDARQSKDFLENVTAVAEHLPPETDPTAEYSNGVFHFGIPIGTKGNGIRDAVLNDDYTLTLNFTDGTSYTSTSIRGETGADGQFGAWTDDDVLFLRARQSGGGGEGVYIYYRTTEDWNAEPDLLSDLGYIYVYTDYMEVDGQTISGIKIGDGKAYVVDLPFIDALSVNHINDGDIHITAAERDFWNNKNRGYVDSSDPETLILTTL